MKMPFFDIGQHRQIKKHDNPGKISAVVTNFTTNNGPPSSPHRRRR